MVYVDGSGELSAAESTSLDGLSTGAVPVKTTTGFTAATQDNIPDGTTYKQYNPAALAARGGTIGGADVTVVGAAFAAPTVSSGSGGLVAGNVVRWSSAGVIAKAQADTAAHAANIAGVWNGTQVVPLAGFNGRVVFDGAVTVGPCWLSQTVAGALTSTAPSATQISIPIGIAYEDLTVGGSYAAKVSNLVSATASVGLRESLRAETCALLGGSPSDWADYFDDFEVLAADGASPLNAISTATGVPVLPSTFQLPAQSSGYAYFKNAVVPPAMTLTSTPWRMSARFGLYGNNYTLIGVQTPSNLANIWVGGDYSVDATKMYLLYGGTPFTHVVLGVRDAYLHYIDLICPGDGTFLCRYDLGAWSAPIALSGGAGARYWGIQCGVEQPAAADVDWWYFATKRT